MKTMNLILKCCKGNVATLGSSNLFTSQPNKYSQHL